MFDEEFDKLENKGGAKDDWKRDDEAVFCEKDKIEEIMEEWDEKGPHYDGDGQKK